MSGSDVLVIGSGIIGSTLAYELARRGATVTLIDAAESGSATAASAGMLAPYLEFADGPLLQLTVAGLDRYDRFIERLRIDADADFEYCRTGSLSVALAPGEVTHLESLASRLAAEQVPTEWLFGRDVRRHEPELSADVAAGLVIKPHGFVMASAVAEASREAARRAGARIEPAGSVVRLSSGAGHLQAWTEARCCSAGVVVLATGSWSGRLAIEGLAVRVPIVPVRGQLVHVRSQRPALHRMTWSERCYLVPWRDGSVLVGATMEEVGFDGRSTAAGVGTLIEAACSVVPALGDATFVGARAGLRPRSGDGLPLIGRSTVVPGLVYATGHFRNGVLLAPITAELVADLLLDDRIDPLLTASLPSRWGL